MRRATGCSGRAWRCAGGAARRRVPGAAARVEWRRSSPCGTGSRIGGEPVSIESRWLSELPGERVAGAVTTLRATAGPIAEVGRDPAVSVAAPWALEASTSSSCAPVFGCRVGATMAAAAATEALADKPRLLDRERVAFIVTAHKHPRQLVRLLRWASIDAEIMLVHLDAKMPGADIDWSPARFANSQTSGCCTRARRAGEALSAWRTFLWPVSNT
jgi:hypothetical protein